MGNIGRLITAFVLAFIAAILYFAYGSIAGGFAIVYLVGMYIIATILLVIVCFIVTLILGAIIIGSMGKNVSNHGYAFLVSFIASIIGEVFILCQTEAWVFSKTGIYSTLTTIIIFTAFAMLNMLIALIITFWLTKPEYY